VPVTEKVKLPEADGVPDKTPADESESPVGSVPDVTAYVDGAVPPADVTVWLYATPTVPLGKPERTMEGQFIEIL
jgi:hypothetical protein